MKNVTLFITKEQQPTFIVGQKIIKDGTETDITVDKITRFFNRITITQSNGVKLKYNNLPYFTVSE